MEEDKNKKPNSTGRLQLKKTINAGQIKQSFSHGRSRSVSVEVKKRRSLTGFSKNEIIEQPKSTDSKLEGSITEVSKAKPEESKIDNAEVSKTTEEDKKTPKKTVAKNFNDPAISLEQKTSETERPKQPKFIKSPKSFENRRQGKLTISQALDDDNEKVRSLAAIKRAREKAKLRSVSNIDNKDSFDSREKKKKRNYYSRCNCR